MRDTGSINRRKVLRSISASFVGIPVFGSQVVGAQERGQEAQNGDIEECIKSFDPGNPDEVKVAVSCFLQIESQDRAGEVLESLQPRRQNALINALKNGDGLEFHIEQKQVNEPPSHVREGMTTTAGNDSEIYRSVVVVKSEIGTKEAEFQHWTNWTYDGDSVSDIEYWKQVNTVGPWLFGIRQQQSRKLTMGITALLG